MRTCQTFTTSGSDETREEGCSRNARSAGLTALRWCRSVGQIPRGLGTVGDTLYAGTLSGKVQGIESRRRIHSEAGYGTRLSFPCSCSRVASFPSIKWKSRRCRTNGIASIFPIVTSAASE